MALHLCVTNVTGLLLEGEIWRNTFSNKIMVTLVTQGLPSSLLARPVV